MKMNEQQLIFNSIITFYEKKIEQAISENNYRSAITWYYELSGANYLAYALKIHSDLNFYRNKEKVLFERILNETTLG